MKVSIITATYNSAKWLENCLISIERQTYSDIEHIIIDGGSTDGTLDIIKHHRQQFSQVVSEPDNGIYDAINKGLRLASGDIIGILNSDDILADTTTIETIVKKMEDTNADIAYGDLLYCHNTSNPVSVIRYWRSKNFHHHSLRYGWMPPHPTVYCRKEVYMKEGEYNTDYKISADYDFLVRTFNTQYTTVYIPHIIVKMTIGGASNRNIKAIYCKMKEDLSVIRNNHIGGLFTLICKNLRKTRQFFN